MRQSRSTPIQAVSRNKLSRWSVALPFESLMSSLARRICRVRGVVRLPNFRQEFPSQTPRAPRTLRLLQRLEHLSGFWSLRIVLTSGSEPHRAIPVENVSRGNRQLPTFVAIHERQVDESAFAHRLLVLGDT